MQIISKIIGFPGGGGGGYQFFCRSFLVKIARIYGNFSILFLTPYFYHIQFTILKGYEKNV